MTDIVEKAAGGDITAFGILYKNVYRKLYYAAYYTLATEREAIDAVKTSANSTFANMSSCKNQRDFNILILKKLSEQIIASYKSYRNNPPVNQKKVPFIKAQMKKLTDAEKLAVTYWTVFDLTPREIAIITGLAEDVVAKKLESGKVKLSPLF